jgi:hypothetical protein
MNIVSRESIVGIASISFTGWSDHLHRSILQLGL